MFRVFAQIIVVVVISFMIGCEGSEVRNGISELPTKLPTFNSKPRVFDSCQQFQEWRDRKWNEWKRTNGNDQFCGTPVLAESNTVASLSSSGNNQEPDVDEPDSAKLDGEFVFFVRKVSDSWPVAYAIEILSASDLSEIQTLTVQSHMRPKLFVFAGDLAVLTNTDTQTRVAFYSEQGRKFSRKKEFATAAYYVDARLRNGQIVLLTQKWIGGDDFDVAKLSVPCDRILESAFDDFNFDLSEIHLISFRNSPTESRGRIGRVDQAYMTSERLYLFSQGYSWFGWDPRLTTDPTFWKSTVSKFDVDDLKSASGVALIDGSVRNQFSFGEASDGKSLFVATTEGFGIGEDRNRIWTLREVEGKFQTVARSEQFGYGETIRSVRFIGDRAYVVTFRFTDPVFTFDLTNPDRVRMLSHLEIPGFSAYLHPIVNGNLFGIGYQTDSQGWDNGLQFSIFNPKADGSVEVVERLELGSRNSHVDVGRNHHAFLYSAELDFAATTARIANSSGSLDFVGALVFQPKAGVGIAARWSHSDLTPPACSTSNRQMPTSWQWAAESHGIQRLLQVPAGVISLSPFGAKLHRISAPWDELRSRKFTPTNVRLDGCLNTY